MRISAFRSQIANAAFFVFLLIGLIIPQSPEAQTLQRSDNPLCDWELRGQIETGLTERFKEKSVNWPPQTLLCLDSPGGNMIEGVALFDSLIVSDVVTVIPPGWRCESACAIAFLAGGVTAGSAAAFSPQRVLYPGGRLGVHAPSLNLPESGFFNADEVSKAFALAVAGADRIVQLSQIEIHGNTPLNGFMLRRILGTNPEDMAMIDTLAEAALAELQLSGMPSPEQLDESTAENACDLAVTLHQRRHQRYGIGQAALFGSLTELRQWRRDTQNSTRQTGTRREYNQTLPYMLFTHYPSDLAGQMLACDVMLWPEPETLENARHSFRDSSQQMLHIKLLSHHWTFRLGEDSAWEDPEVVSSFSVPAWFMHPPETPLARFSPSPDSPFLLPVTDLPGHDLTSHGIRDVSLEGCSQACRETPKCTAFSYVEDREWCWPKSRAAQPTYGYGIISGIMPHVGWKRE